MLWRTYVEVLKWTLGIEVDASYVTKVHFWDGDDDELRCYT